MSDALEKDVPENSDELTAGISEEDQREIILQIDRVVAENRINVDEEIFRLHPEKKSIVFPVMVNIIAVVVLLGGIALLAWLFQAEEQQLIEAGRVVPAAESLLIDEIRREAERELAQKDQEIQEIEARLAAIANERSALESDVQRQIAVREEELRQEFEEELEAERQRLQALNLSEEDIAEQLAAFEAQRQQELDAQLNQFRTAARAEQERLEAELARAEQEFNQNLTAANEERLALEQENQNRLAEIQREMDAQRAAGEQQLSAAQAELEQLSELARRERIIRAQIAGLFSGIAEAIDASNLPLARSRITDLRRLLNEDSTLRIEALREQQRANLFLAQSLENYVDLLERAAADDDRTILLQQIQELEAAAAEAEMLQLTALEERTQVQAAMEQALDEADQRITELLDSIAELTENLESETALRQQTEATLTQTTANLTAQLNEVTATLTGQLEEVTATLTAQLAAAEAATEEERTAAAAAQAAAQAEQERLQGLLAAAEALQATTETELEAAREQIAELQGAVEAERQAIAAMEDTAIVPAEVREELAQLRALQQNVLTARRDFEQYRTGAANVITARAAFNRYLGSSAVATILPGLQSEVTRFEDAFVESGRENALLDMADVVMELSMIDDPQQRINEVQRRIRSAPANSALRSFLTDLQQLLEAS